jgi:hypothetical protein
LFLPVCAYRYIEGSAARIIKIEGFGNWQKPFFNKVVRRSGKCPPGIILLTTKIKRCKIVSMKRTQIQIPDPLYKEVKRLAALRDWSVSEVFRRAVEQLIAQYPSVKRAGEWELPEPRDLGEPLVPSERWRDLLLDDEAGATAARK